jgi:hypothetical protein
MDVDSSPRAERDLGDAEEDLRVDPPILDHSRGLAESFARDENLLPPSLIRIGQNGRDPKFFNSESDVSEPGLSRKPCTRFMWKNLLGCPLEAISKVIPKDLNEGFNKTNAREYAKSLMRAQLAVHISIPIFLNCTPNGFS